MFQKEDEAKAAAPPVESKEKKSPKKKKKKASRVEEQIGAAMTDVTELNTQDDVVAEKVADPAVIEEAMQVDP